MVDCRVSIGQIGEDATVKCFKCEKVLRKVRTLYFIVRDTEDKYNNYCYFCIQSYLENHAGL